jgi:hypothetical protein
MSETLAQARVNVLELIRDQDTNDPFLDDVELAHSIMALAQETAGEVGLGHDWQASAFTLTAGSLADYDITNPTNSEFQEILKLRIAATGNELEKVDWNVIEQMREGLTSASGGGGDPSAFALRMDDSNNTTVRINTVPSESQAIDILRSVLPANTYTDATVIPFSIGLLRGLEKGVASEVIDRMDDTALAVRKISRPLGNRYLAAFERAKVIERARLHKLKTVPRIVGPWR